MISSTNKLTSFEVMGKIVPHEFIDNFWTYFKQVSSLLIVVSEIMVSSRYSNAYIFSRKTMDNKRIYAKKNKK